MLNGLMVRRSDNVPASCWAPYIRTSAAPAMPVANTRVTRARVPVLLLFEGGSAEQFALNTLNLSVRCNVGLRKHVRRRFEGVALGRAAKCEGNIASRSLSGPARSSQAQLHKHHIYLV